MERADEGLLASAAVRKGTHSRRRWLGTPANRQDRAVAMIAAFDAENEGLGAVAETGSSTSILANNPGFDPTQSGKTCLLPWIDSSPACPARSRNVVRVGVSMPTSEEVLGDDAAGLRLVLGGGRPFLLADHALDSRIVNTTPAVWKGSAVVVLGGNQSGTGPFSSYWAMRDMTEFEVSQGQSGVIVCDLSPERWAAFGALEVKAAAVASKPNS